MITFRRLGTLGRFGNQLFQYAGTRLYAELNGFDWAFPPWIGNNIFQRSHLTFGLRHFLLPTVQLNDLQSTSWPERLLEPFGLWRRSSVEKLYAHPRNNIDVYGYLQDEKLLAKLREHRDRVRSWFKFKPDIDAALRKATDQYQPWAAVHIRRGDLVKRNLTVPVSEYLRVLPRVIGDHNLFIASDDSSAISDFQSFRPFVIRHPNFDIPPWAVDFWMLKEASVLLAGGSTFAWWAAFLGNAEYYSPPLTHTWQPGYEPKLEHRTP